MEEIKRELIKKHLEDWTGLKQSSIEHFAQSGKVSGSFFMALKDMLDDYDNQLRLHSVSNSVCDCCVPSPEDPFEYENPICRKCGCAMKQTDC